MSEKDIQACQENNQIKNILDTFCEKFNSLGFDREIKLHCDEESEAAATVWGQYQGIGDFQKINTSKSMQYTNTAHKITKGSCCN